jgi:Fe-S cluster assembly protein SufD
MTMVTAVASDIRQRAADAFAKLGWPTTRIEQWRYTNLAPVQKVAWRKDEAPTKVEAPETLTGRAALELIFVNGTLVDRSGSLDLASAGEARIADWQQDAMVALNAANEQDGASIEIPAGMVVDGFIHLLFIGKGDGIWSHPRNVIVAGANSQVTVAETYIGSGAYFTNAVTEIVAAEGAVVDHYRVQCESPTAFHVGNVYVKQERSSNVTSRNISIGSTLSRAETHVVLGGEGAIVTLDGLFAGTGTQHLDTLTAVDHAAPHCDSIQLYKGVLDESSRGIFDGRIIVRPGAVKTNSRQENRNLLLSETAIVDSKPNLEIHNDDVKCSHGSTIGQINEEALFYLQSRGIDRDEARSLLVFAFASEVVDRMNLEPVREQVRRALFEAMPQRLPERRAEGRGPRAEG